MGLQTDQRARDKFDYNNAVEKSYPMHIGNERLDQQVQNALDRRRVNPLTDALSPTTPIIALDILTVHDLIDVRVLKMLTFIIDNTSGILSSSVFLSI